MSIILWKGIGGDKDKAESYEKSTTIKQLGSTDNKSICNSLRSSISDKAAFLKRGGSDLSDHDRGEILYCIEDEYLNTLLYVRLYTSAGDSIFWESNVVFYEGRYCLAYFRDEDKQDYDLIPLSVEVSDYIESVISQSQYSFDYEYKHTETE